MWDERYRSDDYVYGTQPNDFLKANAGAIQKGKVLSLAEGEGRNAVFLAKSGYEVTAVDSSSVGLEKAARLAKENDANIEFILADLNEYQIEPNHWDGIVSIFFPLKSEDRISLYRKVSEGLKTNGVFLLEAYTPEQIAFGTGGGDNIEFMQSRKTLENELIGLDFEHLLETERVVLEGKYHTGKASVLQAIARKKILEQR